jgi:hypothetical protein
MRFLVIAHRREEVSQDDYATHRESEIRQALRLLKEDHIREVYSFAKGGGAVLLMEAADEGQARALLDTLPMIHLGLVRIELYGLRAYGGFFAGLSPSQS